jgi:succinoglycan biosynthesis transport protein ExoP
LQDQIEILRSTNLAEAVVEELRLDQNPEFNPRLRPPVVTVMDRVREFVTVPEWARDSLRDLGIMEPPSAGGPPPDPEEVAALERRIVTEALLARLAIRPVPDSRVIEIGVLSENPRTAAIVANAFAEQYIFDQLEARLDATRTATGWLSGRVEELRERLQVAEEAVESARASQSFQAGKASRSRSSSSGAERHAFRRSQRDTHGRGDLPAAERGAGGRNRIRRDPGVPHLAPDQPVPHARTELLSQRATLLETVNEEHPAVQRVDTLLEEAARTMRDEAEQIVESARLEWQSLQQEETDIEAMCANWRRWRSTSRATSHHPPAGARGASQPHSLRELPVAASGDLGTGTLEEPDVRILTRAEPPFSPQTQRQNRTLAVSLIAGRAGRDRDHLPVRQAQQHLPLRTAAGADDRRNGAGRHPGRRQTVAAQNRAAALPREAKVRPCGGRPKPAHEHPLLERRQAAKGGDVHLLRPARRQVDHGHAGRHDQPPDGPSAIIVDCDLRLPALADLLGTKTEGPGLLSAIEGTATLEEAIHRDEESGLHVLMTKPSEPRSTVNAADILSSKRFDDMIEELKRPTTW